MGTGDALVVPRQLLEGAAAAVDGAEAVDDQMGDALGIEQLDGGGLRAKRHIAGLHGPVVLQARAAVEGGAGHEVQVDMAAQLHRANLIVAGGHHHASATLARTIVDGTLQGLGAQYGGVGASPIIGDDIIAGSGGNSPQRDATQSQERGKHRNNGIFHQK